MTASARRRRYLGPSAIIFIVALVVSLGVHLQAFVTLGALTPLLHGHGAPPPPVEIAFEEVGDGTPPQSPLRDSPDDEPDVTAGPIPENAIPTARNARPVAPPAPRVEPAVHHVVHAPPPSTPPAATPPTPVQHDPHDQRQSVTQRSDDPSVLPPEDARFLARENRRVEEETVANLRNLQRDDAQPSAGHAHASEEEAEGDASETESADLRNREGSDARRVTPREAEQERPREADDTPPPNVVARGDNAAQGAAGEESQGTTQLAPQAAGRAAFAGGGVEEASAPITISDPAGSWTIRLPSAARRGAGAGDAGGRASSGSGMAMNDDGGGRGAGGRAGAAGGGRGTGQAGPDLRISWATYEDTFTPEELQRDREAYIRERRSRARGTSHAQDWQTFRAAIENYVPGVRPGNQTALNAAASPFADYLAEVHRRIHPQFAEHFLPSLPAVGDSPYADHSLMTKLEIVFERDGRVHRIGVVESSGYLPYDFGAFEAVMRGQPYPEAPEAILSGDGRVYMRWGFYRNERQCGTFNAEPYILPHPPGEPQPGHGPLIDHPEPGGIIPTDAPGPGDRPRSPVHGVPSGDALPHGG